MEYPDAPFLLVPVESAQWGMAPLVLRKGSYYELTVYQRFWWMMCGVVRCQRQPKSKWQRIGQQHAQFSSAQDSNPTFAWTLLTFDSQEVHTDHVVANALHKEKLEVSICRRKHMVMIPWTRDIRTHSIYYKSLG